MNVLRFALIAAAMLSLTRGASAAPAPGLASMTFFNGSWTCKRTANPDRSVVGTTFAFTSATEHHWILASFSDGQLNLTYDAAAKRYAFIYVGTNGAYEMLTSPGWKSGVMRLTDTVLSNGRSPGVATFTRHGAAVFTSSYVAGASRYDTICARD